MKKSEIEECIVKYGKDLYSFCCYLTRNKQEADDLYQDTFLKAIELGGINIDQNPKSFLLSIAYRLSKNRRRKLANQSRFISAGNMEDMDEKNFKNIATVSPEESMIHTEIQKQVQSAVKCLPDKLRIVALLYYMEERHIAEIAAIIHVPQGTIKSRLHKARKLLKEQLEDVL